MFFNLAPAHMTLEPVGDTVEPIAFPEELFTAFGFGYDPYHWTNSHQSHGSSATDDVTAVGQRVGNLHATGGNGTRTDGNGTNNGRLWADDTTQRVTLVEFDDRLGWRGNGTQGLWRFCTGVRMSVSMAHTVATMIWLDGTTVGFPFGHLRGELGSSYLDAALFPLYRYAGEDFRQTVSHNSATPMVDQVIAPAGSLSGWHIAWVEVGVTAFDSPGGGSAYSSLGNTVLLDDSPITPATPVSSVNRISICGILPGNESFIVEGFTGVVGRSFWVERAFSPTERATLKQWLKGKEFIAP